MQGNDSNFFLPYGALHPKPTNRSLSSSDHFAPVVGLVHQCDHQPASKKARAGSSKNKRFTAGVLATVEGVEQIVKGGLSSFDVVTLIKAIGTLQAL